MSTTWPVVKVTGEVIDERSRQDAKWGEQNHPDGTDSMWALERDAVRRDCEEAAQAGLLTWKHILLEEVAEAFAEQDVTLLRAELLQVAAVAVAWIEAIDRRTE